MVKAKKSRIYGWFARFVRCAVLRRVVRGALLAALALGPVRAANLSDINKALADMQHLSGQFVQSTPDGQTLQGDFFLALPDRFRFVYTSGAQSIVTLRGNWLVVQETQGAAANRYPVSATPLRLFVDGRAPRIAASQLETLSMKRGAIEAALRDPDGAIPGRLVLVFDAETLALQGWRLIDIQQQRSSVWLHNVTRHERLSEDYFYIDESIAEAEDE